MNIENSNNELTATQRADALEEECEDYRNNIQIAANQIDHWRNRAKSENEEKLKELERISALSRQLTSVQAENRKMRTALERIERWHGEFPPTGKTWNDGSPLSYSAAFGSNGESDYMREVARAALTPPPDVTEAQSAAKTEDDLCLCGSGHKVGECWRYASCTDAAKKKGHKFS